MRKTDLLALLLALATALVAADAEAGRQKKNKKDRKPAPSAAAPAESDQPAPGLVGPSAAVETARRHLLAYETAAARQALDGAAADDAWAATTRGWVLQQENDFAAAAVESRRAAGLDPRNPAPLLKLGESLTYAEKAGAGEAYAEAEKRARALVAANAADVEALTYLGVAQQRQQRFDESAATLARALELAPDDNMARFHLGTARFYQQRWQDAFDELGRVIDRTPAMALAYYYRGLAAGKLERKDILYNDLDRFVRMAPAAPEADYARRLLAAFG